MPDRRRTQLTRWVALLRAVNLGSFNRIGMPALRDLLASLGYGEVDTYLQSGNAVFTAKLADADAISAKIAAELGLDVVVLLRTGAELAAIVGANPFPGADAKQLHVAFTAEAPPAVDIGPFPPDEFAFGDRVVYQHLRNGVSGSKLPNWEKVLRMPVTARNWTTVCNLAAMAGA